MTRTNTGIGALLLAHSRVTDNQVSTRGWWGKSEV
jgi:hypothetical protein